MPDQVVVGRDAELRVIGSFLDGAEPDAAVLLIEGEAGIGKTTVWQASIAAAERRAMRVLQAQPAESEFDLSYAALADLLATAYDDVRAELPEPQRRGLDVALLRATSDADADPRRTAAGFLSVLSSLASARPVVLAIDDVQWLDRASARVLEFAVRRLPPGVLVLIARREASDGSPSLGAAPDRLVRLRLAGLSVAALHHVLRDRLGAAPARPQLLRLTEASGGNPFFAVEIARALELGRSGIGAELLPVPGNVHELLGGRIDALSRIAREAALVAAALSRPTRGAITHALGPGGDVPAALDEAELADVLVTDGERVRFTHPLLASAVYASVSGSRRLELHRQLAGIVSDPEERARHLALSTTEPDARAAEEIERGAQRAATRGAQDAAADLYEAAHRLTPPGSTEERTRRSIGEATAVLAVGDLSRARALAEEAVARSPAGSLRAESLFLLSQVAWVDGIDSATTHLEQALVEAGEERRLRGRIHGRLAAVSVRDQRVAVEHADAAARLLREDEDPGLLAYALVGSLFFGAQVGFGARPELLARALELEARAGPDAQKHPLILVWLQSVDDFEAARERHEVEDRWYRDRGEEGWRAARQAAQRAKVELRAGHWSLAERLAEEGCATIEQLGGHGPWSNSLMARAQIDAVRGRIERARATLLPIVEEMEQTGSQWFAALALASLGFAELAAGDAAAAAAAYERVERHLEAVGVVCPLPLRTEPDHIEALVGLGELDRAQRVLDRFEERARSFPRLWTGATLPRSRSLVLAAAGDLVGALAQLEQASEVDLLPFELARTLLVQGQLQRRLRQKQRAAASLRRSLELFELLGAPHWVEQAQAELERVGLRRGDPDELTPSERRIAELAASGLTNREVAKAAFVSPKTVEANLARAYRKLGIRTRAELGARMSAQS